MERKILLKCRMTSPFVSAFRYDPNSSLDLYGTPPHTRAEEHGSSVKYGRTMMTFYGRTMFFRKKYCTEQLGSPVKYGRTSFFFYGITFQIFYGRTWFFRILRKNIVLPYFPEEPCSSGKYLQSCSVK